ncbi:hypothetical protein LQU94_02370 [Peptoniphilus sp. KCTC 25270]|uniref:DUF6648 family protein n=1 Tax=Peptoniphilus sp. KCTC 25270 TaxID=2897414 RepID=UPI001E39E9E2|nr:DUF6648 family protein [Peptoniphilus sp. KCTC 25270]MCD1146958.1 hypothetical protein [Peptoniphilus sp. KCTC 25270]
MLSDEFKVKPLEPIREDWFQNFIERRSELIQRYETGEFSKREFILENINQLHQSNLQPFIRIDRIEKGIFNYQYYNGMAKYYSILAKEIKYEKKKKREYCRYLGLTNKYYHLKDVTIHTILKFCDYKDIDAYYIHCKSSSLQGELYEIHLKSQKETIFHSKSCQIKEVLEKHNLFCEERKASLIENYINERY